MTDETKNEEKKSRIEEYRQEINEIESKAKESGAIQFNDLRLALLHCELLLEVLTELKTLRKGFLGGGDDDEADPVPAPTVPAPATTQ